jgi:hypothetical protein
MERLTRSFNQLASRLTKIGTGYLGVNIVLLAAEARWHLIYHLTLWDVSEMKTFGFLLGKTLHP